MQEYQDGTAFIKEAYDHLITGPFALTLTKDDKRILDLIVNAIVHIDRPATIKCNWFGVEDNMASPLSATLTKGSHPITLDFTGTDISKEDVRSLANALKKTERPVTLILSSHPAENLIWRALPSDRLAPVDDDYLSPLAEALAVMRTSCRLSLKHSSVFIPGFIGPLASALKKAKCPHTINLSNTMYQGDKKAAILIDALLQTTVKHTIIAEGNRLSNTTLLKLNARHYHLATCTFFEKAETLPDGRRAALPPLAPMVLRMLEASNQEQQETRGSSSCLVM